MFSIIQNHTLGKYPDGADEKNNNYWWFHFLVSSVQSVRYWLGHLTIFTVGLLSSYNDYLVISNVKYSKLNLFGIANFQGCCFNYNFLDKKSPASHKLLHKSIIIPLHCSIRHFNYSHEFKVARGYLLERKHPFLN